MSDIFFVSDTHWGHSRIIQYSSRPFSSVDEMNETLIKNWNDRVKPGDLVYHNGDFAFMPYDKFKSLLNRLNGKIYVQLGNHDKMLVEHKADLLRAGKIVSIENYRELKIAGKTIILFHYGCRVWNKSHAGSILLYGHSHGSLPPYGKSVDIGVDCKEITHEYRPIHLDEIMKYMSKRETPVADHHGVKEVDDA